jgi:hypothetical protein
LSIASWKEHINVATKQTKIIAGAAIVILVGGGWLFAKHQATSIAQDRIDGWIIRHDLRGKVAYDDLSASPFGSATLTGVKVKVSPTITIGVASLDVSDLEMKYDQLRSVNIAARGMQVPLLAIAREQPLAAGGGLREAVGMGYTTLTGDLSVALRYEDTKGTISFETTADFEDAGSWKVNVSLGGIDPSGIDALNGIASASAQTNGMDILAAAGQGVRSLASLNLTEADVSIDTSGVHRRELEVTNHDVPPDGATSDIRGVIVDEMALVKAGMAPSEASEARTAVDSWFKKGGSLRIVTNLSQPLPLFRNGNFFTPAFDSLAGYLTATKSRISN